MRSTLLIVIGFSMLAGNAVAAQAADSSPLASQFRQLDSNGDGLLSHAEAAVNPKVSALYESMDTRSTIQDPAQNTKPGGITLDQFESGMQAAQTGGTVGPAASGGEVYKVYPNGTRVKEQGTGVSAQ